MNLAGAYELHPKVALRPEPFGALAYHYGNRRLVFLKSPELVATVRALASAATAGDALAASGVAAERWPAYAAALDRLQAAEVIRAR